MRPTFLSLLKADATREQLEEWCRGQTRVMPAGDVNLCRVLGKYLMYVIPQDLTLTPHLALDGIWESWVTMAIARHLKPGMRCMDVGACYGYYSLLMADVVGPSGYVEAWEPIYEELVGINAALNGLDLTVVPYAMGPGAYRQETFAHAQVQAPGLFDATGSARQERSPGLRLHR